MRQPFTASCHSGTSASTARANTSSIQVLVSVIIPPARYFLNAPYSRNAQDILVIELFLLIGLELGSGRLGECNEGVCFLEMTGAKTSHF